MKTITLPLAALALSCAGCSSFDTAKLQGLDVASFQWSESYPAASFNVAAFGVRTDPTTHVTTIDSITIRGQNPFGGGGGSITGLQIGGNKPAPVLSAAGVTK